MKVGNQEVKQIIVKTADGELIASITDENVIEKEGYAVEYEPLDD